jgi:cytosine/adenosine deaminase-related metal-dependent hydrolase
MMLNNVITSYCKTPVTVSTGGNDALRLDFDNAILFPGLVNSHDHLDFNLFPQFGGDIYNNYTEWGSYIHKKYKSEIAAVLQVPLELRIQWGIFKNLLCGVTTVVNHGAYLNIDNSPITVLQTPCIHSVQFDKLWKLKLNNPLKRKQQVVVHVGEGKDKLASKEIDQLIRWNLWGKKTVAVHGVVMSAEQVKNFKALVWCPQSNFFLLNKTAQIDELKDCTSILFGTDSILTSNWNIWHHINLARNTKLLDDEELYNTLNKNASKVWALQDEEDDVVIAKNRDHNNFYNAFYAVRPEDILLVIHRGNIRLFDEQILTQLSGINIEKYSRVCVNGIYKYVEGNLATLVTEIKAWYPDAKFPVTVDNIV